MFFATKMRTGTKGDMRRSYWIWIILSVLVIFSEVLLWCMSTSELNILTIPDSFSALLRKFGWVFGEQRISPETSNSLW